MAPRASESASGGAGMHVARATLGYNVLAALNAANAWHAFDRRSFASVASFTGGWPTSELPVPALAAHIAANAVAAHYGGFRGRLAPVNAALGLGAAAGLVAIERSARSSRE